MTTQPVAGDTIQRMAPTPSTKAAEKPQPPLSSAGSSPGDLLASWCADGTHSLEDVMGALAATDESVDSFLEGRARDMGFATKLLDDHVFELSAILDEIEPLPGGRWVALARLDAHAFSWNLEAEAVLPLSDQASSQSLEQLLLKTLSAREDRPVLLRWLSHPAFLGEGEAILRIERALAEAGTALTWEDRLDTVKILARRGGRWPAARALEHLLRYATLDAAEAGAVHARAVTFVDATLLGVLATYEPWRSDPDLTRELAEQVPTDELIEAFAPPSGEQLARREAQRPGSARRAAWMTLARRSEAKATDTVGRLIVRSAIFIGDESLAAGLCAILIAERQEHAVDALVAAFLAGLHRRSPGLAIERLLRTYPERALRSSLELMPDWVHTFEPDAMARLAFRVLPRLPAEAHERIASEALMTDGERGLILLDELEALA